MDLLSEPHRLQLLTLVQPSLALKLFLQRLELLILPLDLVLARCQQKLLTKVLLQLLDVLLLLKKLSFNVSFKLPLLLADELDLLIFVSDDLMLLEEVDLECPDPRAGFTSLLLQVAVDSF